MKYANEVIHVLKHTLQINNMQLKSDTLLLGNLPELDSMAIVSVITALEENFDIVVDDEDISAEHFQSVGSLVALIEDKLNAA